MKICLLLWFLSSPHPQMVVFCPDWGSPTNLEARKLCEEINRVAEEKSRRYNPSCRILLPGEYEENN